LPKWQIKLLSLLNSIVGCHADVKKAKTVNGEETKK